MAEAKWTRRSLLAVGGALCLQQAGCGAGDLAGYNLPATVAAGAASALAVNSIRVVPSVPLALGRDSGGVYALGLLCTHQGCDMSGPDGAVSEAAIVCYCHGSRFSATGAVTLGPASSALPHFPVTVDASGQLTIHTDSTVAASTRLPV